MWELGPQLLSEYGEKRWEPHECFRLLECGKGREMDALLKPSERNVALPTLDFKNLVILLLNSNVR